MSHPRREDDPPRVVRLTIDRDATNAMRKTPIPWGGRAEDDDTVVARFDESFPLYRIVDGEELRRIVEATKVTGGTFSDARERSYGASWSHSLADVMEWGRDLGGMAGGPGHGLGRDLFVLRIDAKGRRFYGALRDAASHFDPHGARHQDAPMWTEGCNTGYGCSVVDVRFDDIESISRYDDGELTPMTKAQARSYARRRANPVSPPSPPSLRDQVHAIDHADVHGDSGWKPSDFELTYLGEKSVAELGEYDDVPAWLDLDRSDCESEAECLAALRSFRGGMWADRAAGWLREGIPPIVVIDTPVTEDGGGTTIGDGRGRVNVAALFGLRVPTWLMTLKRRANPVDDKVARIARALADAHALLMVEIGGGDASGAYTRANQLLIRELEAIYPDVSFVENQSCVDVEGERIYLGLRPPEGWAHALKRLDTPHGGAELYVDGSCGSRTGGYCGRSFNGAARAFVRVMDERHPAREDAPRGAYRTGPRRANPVDSTSLSEREFMGVGMYGVVLCDGKGRAFKVARYETPTSYASLEDEAEWLRDAAKVPAVAPHVARFRSWHPDEGVIHDLIRAEMIPNGWGAPEFKGDSYVLRESDGRPVLVDAGMAIRYGKNLLKYARAVEPKKGAQITLPDGRRATVLLEHDAPGERKVFVRGEDGQEEWLPLSALRRDNPVGGSVQWKKTPGSVAQIATKTSLFAVSEDKRFIVHVNRYGSPRDRGYGYSFSVTDYAVPDEARGTAYTSVDIPNISRGERALEWATAWAEKRVARRENPRKPAKLSPTGLVAVRAADFRDTGTYKVKSGTKVVRMFRDPENGWWYEDAAGHHSERCLGFTKEEALEKILEKYGALRLENPLSPPGGGRPGAMDYERACPRCGTKMSKFKASAHPKTKACAAICAAICAQQRATAQALPAAASAPLATAALANGAAYQRGIERALGPDFDRHVLSLIPEARQEAAVAPLAPPAPARGRRGNPVLTWHDDNENLPARFVRAPEGTLVSDVVNHGIKDRWGRSLGHFSKITPTTVWNGTRNVLAEPPEWVVTTHATRDGREYGSGHHARSAPFTSLDEAKRSAARRIDEAKKRYEHELKVGTASWVPKPGEPIRQSPAARSEEEAAARAARAEQRKAEKEAKLAAAAEKAAGAEAAVIARRAKLMTEATAKSLRLLGQLKDKTSLDETARAKAVKAISDVVEMLWKYHLTGMPSIEPEQLTPGIDAEVVRLGIGGRAVYHNGVESTIYGESWDYYVRRQKEIAEAKDLQARANQALPGTLQSGTPRR